MGRMRTILFITLLLLATGASLYATTYQTRQLSTPDGSTSEAWRINDSGQAIGSVWSTSATSAALWQASGVLNTPIAGDAFTHDINNQGQFTGEFMSSDGYSHPYIWGSGTGIIDLSTDLPRGARMKGINAGGSIVGIDGLDYPYAALTWDSASGVTYLPTDGYESYVVAGISDSGVVAGTVDVAPHTPRAFTWSADSGMTILFPDGSWNGVTAMSSGGTLLGWSSAQDQTEDSFIWSAERGKISLPFNTQDDGISPCAVNDRGMVTGTMYSSGGTENVFVWSLETGFTILGEGRAHDINNAGWVVGSVGNSQDTHAALWHPVPEPSSLLVLGMGMLPMMRGLARRQRRR